MSGPNRRKIARSPSAILVGDGPAGIEVRAERAQDPQEEDRRPPDGREIETDRHAGGHERETGQEDLAGLEDPADEHAAAAERLGRVVPPAVIKVVAEQVRGALD